MANNIKGITIEIGGSTQKLDQALKGVNSTAKSLQNELKAVNTALKLDPTNVEAARKKQELLTEAVKNTKEKLETLKTAQEQAQAAFERGDMSEEKYRAIETEIQKTENELKSLENELKDCNGAWDAHGAKIQEVGDKMQAVGEGMTNAGEKLMPVTAALGGVGVAAVKTAADFESSMSNVAAISGATGDDLKALEDKAREMGSSTKFSASEAADAMSYMAMAGWKTEDMLDGISGIMNLAAASGEDLAATSDIVTDALTAFGLTAADSGHFADILAAASSNANTNVSMMGETFKYAAPVAGALGFSAEDTAQAIGLMANSGIKASQAGTSLRTIMNAMAGDIKFATDSGEEFTIATTNADGSMRDLNTILAECRDAFGQLSESEQANNAQAVFGKNAMSGWLALMNAAPADIEKLSSAIDNCTYQVDDISAALQQSEIDVTKWAERGLDSGDVFNGMIDDVIYNIDTLGTSTGEILDYLQSEYDLTADEAKIALETITEGMEGSTGAAQAMADIMQDNLNGQLTTLKSALEEAAISIGNVLLPTIKEIVAKIQEWTTKFNGLDDGVKRIIVAVGLVVASIAPMLVVGGKLLTGIGKMTSGIGGLVAKIGGAITKAGGLGAALSAALPVVAIVAAIAAIVAAFVHLYKTNDEFREKVNAAVAQVKAAFQDMAEKIKPLLETLKEEFDKLMTALQPVFDFLIERVMAFVQGVVAAMPSIISAITNVVDFVTNIVNAVIALLHGDFDGFFSYLSGAWQNIVDFIKNILSAWASFLSTYFSGVWTTIKNIFSTVASWFGTMFTNAYNNIVNAFKAIGQWFAARWTDIKNALSTVASWFLTMFQNAYNNVVNVFKAIGQWFAARWTDIKNALSTVASWFGTMFTNAVNNVKNAFAAIGQWFSARWTDIKNVFSNVASFFQEKFNAAAQAVKNAFQAIPQFFSDLWTKITGIFVDAGQKVADGVMGAFKSACNAVFGTIENIVNGFVNAINSVIGVINEIPGVSIGKLSGISLPRLAKGGILSKGQAIVGEAGAELLTVAGGKAIVTPLSDKARSDTLSAAGAKGGFTQNNYITSPKALSPYETARQVRNQTRNMVLQLQGS